MRRRVDNSVCRSVPVDSDGLAKCSSGVHHGYFRLTVGSHCFLKLRGQPVTIVGMPITRTLSECAHRTVCTQSQAATPTSCSNSTDDVATMYISAQGTHKTPYASSASPTSSTSPRGSVSTASTLSTTILSSAPVPAPPSPLPLNC